MILPPSAKDNFFISFEGSIATSMLPDQFTQMSDDGVPHPLCLRAADHLKQHLTNQIEWYHNFGLLKSTEGVIIGKMFGVLVVKTIQSEIGYLAAFSGKLAGGNHHAKFVPPVFDGLTDNGFVNKGMIELTRINNLVRDLEALKPNDYKQQIIDLKVIRRNHSSALQKEIYGHYHFLNQAGEQKSLAEIFKNAAYKNPPSGAGECAAPKLLQYAFKHNMKPLALAEFWWGQSPKSDYWKHGQFYPCCREKCEPILAHMLA